MGLPSDHRGSTVHYLPKLPINFLSHSPPSVSPSLTSFFLSAATSVSLSDFVCISLFFLNFYLPLSVCFHLSLQISHSHSGLFVISPYCLSQSSGSVLPSALSHVLFLLVTFLSDYFNICFSLCSLIFCYIFCLCVYIWPLCLCYFPSKNYQEKQQS